MIHQILVSVLVLGVPAVAVGAPSVSNPSLFPQSWEPTLTAGAGWLQKDFAGAGLGPAEVQVNSAADGSDGGGWSTRYTDPGPLVSGPNNPPAPGFDVSDLEGRHRVRVVIPGAEGSPLTLGTLQLDRTPPRALDPLITTDADLATIRWTQDDGGLSGTDPAAALVVEVEGGEGGPWRPVDEPPGSAGDGPMLARTATTGMGEGGHPVRVRSRDRAGNAGVRVLGTLMVDRRPPVITGVRVLRAPTAVDPTVEIAFRVEDPQPGAGLGTAARARAVIAGTDLVVGEAEAGPGERTLTARLPGPGAHQVVVRVGDLAGRVGASAPLAVLVPRPEAPPAGPAEVVTVPAGALEPALEERVASGAAPDGPGWAYAALGRLHAARGVPLRGRLVVARGDAQWRRALGGAAARWQGAATAGGTVLVSPVVAARLDALRVANRPGRRRPSPAAARALTSALAVLLHETLHVTGAQAPADVRTPAGRALEEGLTEAATADLLPAAVSALGLRAPVARALRGAAGRYGPAYRPQVAWVRALSGRATGRGWRTTRATAWRVQAADGWGADRWARLGAALDLREDALRASIPELGRADLVR